ncbi:MAG: hypothetical protein P8Y02_11785 [Deinococcales bacterium]
MGVDLEDAEVPVLRQRAHRGAGRRVVAPDQHREGAGPVQCRHAGLHPRQAGARLAAQHVDIAGVDHALAAEHHAVALHVEQASLGDRPQPRRRLAHRAGTEARARTVADAEVVGHPEECHRPLARLEALHQRSLEEGGDPGG